MAEQPRSGQYRQGDVLLVRVEDDVKARPHRGVARDAGRIVLAYGEATGHAHAIADPDAELIELETGERFLLDSGAHAVQADEFGTLYRREMLDDEPLVMVKVRNSTPEPDGSHKSYFLRVPPNVETAREAVAWTFGLEASDYGPSVQT